MNEQSRRGWLFDVAVGGVIGGLMGAVVAVNLVIFSGIEDGYEASLVEVFDQSILIGVLTVAILLAGPILGVFAARRRRLLIEAERDQQLSRVAHIGS